MQLPLLLRSVYCEDGSPAANLDRPKDLEVFLAPGRAFCTAHSHSDAEQVPRAVLTIRTEHLGTSAIENNSPIIPQALKTLRPADTIKA